MRRAHAEYVSKLNQQIIKSGRDWAATGWERKSAVGSSEMWLATARLDISMGNSLWKIGQKRCQMNGMKRTDEHRERERESEWREKERERERNKSQGLVIQPATTIASQGGGGGGAHKREKRGRKGGKSGGGGGGEGGGGGGRQSLRLPRFPHTHTKRKCTEGKLFPSR